MAGVGSQRDWIPSVVRMVMSKQNGVYLSLFRQRKGGGNPAGIHSQNARLLGGTLTVPFLPQLDGHLGPESLRYWLSITLSVAPRNFCH